MLAVKARMLGSVGFHVGSVHSRLMLVGIRRKRPLFSPERITSKSLAPPSISLESMIRRPSGDQVGEVSLLLFVGDNCVLFYIVNVVNLICFVYSIVVNV